MMSYIQPEVKLLEVRIGEAVASSHQIYKSLEELVEGCDGIVEALSR